MQGIYMLTNKVNGKSYIGKSKDIENRMKQHKNDSFNSNALSYNHYFHTAIRKHGWENFELTILEECPNTTQEELFEKEIAYIALYDTFNNGYNLTPGGEGITWTPEIQLKKETTYFNKTGYKNPFQNLEVKEKIKEINYNNTGFENPMQNPDVLFKREEDYYNKTGFENPRQNPEVQRKASETYFNNTGYYHPMQNPEVKAKAKDTYYNKTGYNHPLQNPESVKKRKEDFYNKTGYEYPSQVPEIAKQIRDTHFRIGNTKPLINIETGCLLTSLGEAAIWAGLGKGSGTSIGKNARGENSYAGKVPITGEPAHWRYATQEEIAEYIKTLDKKE